MRNARYWVIAIAMAALSMGSGTATSASLSYDDPGCADFQITPNGNGYTLSCTFLSTPGCQLRAFPPNPVAGSAITLVATCTNNPYGWIFAKGATPNSQAQICGTNSTACQDTVPSAGSIIYTVLAGNAVGRGPVTSITVNWR